MRTAERAEAWRMANRRANPSLKTVTPSTMDSTVPDFDKLRAVPPQRAYALLDEQGCYVRGRYGWSTQGPGQGDVDHYGLSLMECLTPVMRIRRETGEKNEGR